METPPPPPKPISIAQKVKHLQQRTIPTPLQKPPPNLLMMRKNHGDASWNNKSKEPTSTTPTIIDTSLAEATAACYKNPEEKVKQEEKKQPHPPVPKAHPQKKPMPKLMSQTKAQYQLLKSQLVRQKGRGGGGSGGSVGQGQQGSGGQPPRPPPSSKPGLLVGEEKGEDPVVNSNVRYSLGARRGGGGGRSHHPPTRISPPVNPPTTPPTPPPPSKKAKQTTKKPPPPPQPPPQVWICLICNTPEQEISLDPMICCDGCEDWYHFHCVGIQDGNVPEGEWFCGGCKGKVKKKKGRK